MSSKVRSLARGIARAAMKEEGTKLFKQYAPVEGKVKRYGKYHDEQIMRSVFSRSWRNYVYEME